MSNIAIFTNSIFTVGGEQRVVSVIANGLSENHNITLFTMDPKSKLNHNIYGLSEKIKVRLYNPYKFDFISFIYRIIVHVFPKIAYDKNPGIVDRAYYPDMYADKMYDCIKKEGSFDTIIVTSWQLSIILGKVVEKYKLYTKTIGWQHSSYEGYFKTKYLYLYNRDVVFKKYVSSLSECVVLNEDYANKYLCNFDIKCRVIYNPKSFSSKEKADMRNLFFVTCGRFTYLKRLDLMIDAFASFAKGNKEWKLILIGDGILKRKLQSHAKNVGISDRVIFWGETKDVKSPLLKASVFLLTSEYEGFPMCLTEAFELGIPAIAFDIPALGPFSKNGETILVNSHNTEQFAYEMNRIATDYQLRKTMQQRALNTASELSLDLLIKKWEDIV